MKKANPKRASTNSTERGRVLALDGLRGIAILMVLAFHVQLSGVLPQSSLWLQKLHLIMSSGWAGVDMFFVLSGFLITGILLDTKDRPGRARVFYARRALRIFPLFYLAVFGGMAVTILAPHSTFVQGWFPRLKEWALYVCYLQNWVIPLSAHPILSHFWSLGVEEQFYLLWPWCVWMVPRNQLPWVCLGGILTALGIRFVILTYQADGSKIVWMNTFCRMDALLFGSLCALALRSVRWSEFSRRVFVPLGIAVLVVVLVVESWGRDGWTPGYWTQLVGYTALATGFSALLLTAFFQSGTGTILNRTLQHPLLRFCGKYSYGLYVWHAPLLILGYVRFHHAAWWGHRFVPAAIYSVGMVAISIFVAFLSYELYEKWFLLVKPKFHEQPNVPGSRPVLVRADGQP